MRTLSPIPTDLRIAAWLFVVRGVLAVAEVIVQAAHDHVSINFNVLCIPIGLGLLRLRRGWRALALVFVGISLIALPIVCALVLAGSGPARFHMFGLPMGTVDRGWFAVAAAVLFVFEVWQCRVLLRREVAARFGGSEVADRRGVPCA